MGLTTAALKSFPIKKNGFENCLIDNYEICISLLLWEANVFKESHYKVSS